MERFAELDHSLDDTISTRLNDNIAVDYWKHDELLVLDEAIPADWLRAIQDEVLSLRPRVQRRSVWGYKAAGSLAYGVLAEHAPRTMALYHSKTLAKALSKLADQPLRVCPDSDPHACAVYWYEEPGDRVGFHYDTSLYNGARYTLLLGLVDESSARLQCRVHAKNRERKMRALDVQTTPGKLVFFNGSKLLHAVSPIQEGERRIVLSMQLVTDPAMSPSNRVISMIKDAIAYFGLDSFKAPKRPLVLPGQPAAT